jgi:hypothetical protein
MQSNDPNVLHCGVMKRFNSEVQIGEVRVCEAAITPARRAIFRLRSPRCRSRQLRIQWKGLLPLTGSGTGGGTGVQAS